MHTPYWLLIVLLAVLLGRAAWNWRRDRGWTDDTAQASIAAPAFALMLALDAFEVSFWWIAGVAAVALTAMAFAALRLPRHAAG